MTAQKASRRDFLKAAAATAGAGVLATTGVAAGTKTAAAATSVRAGGIEPTGVFWGLNYAPHVAAYHRMAALFKKLYGSTVTVQPQPGVPYANVIAAIAAGTQPDLVFTLGQFVTGLALQDALQGLSNSVYKANHIVVSRDFAGDAVDAFSFNGQIYGVPCETDGGLGTMINVPVDDVKRLGLADKYPPTNGQIGFDSYDQLFALAKDLQVVKNGTVVKYGLCSEGWDDSHVGSIMLQLDTPLFDIEHETFNFTTPAGVEAINYHAYLPVKLGIDKEWNDTAACVDAIYAGKAAMSLGNVSPTQIGDIQYGFHYEIALIPKLNGKEPIALGDAGGWGTIAPVKAPHPHLQTAFLRMMCTRAGQYEYDLTYGGVDGCAWKDILVNDTSRFHPANATNPSYGIGISSWWKLLNTTCKYVGPCGYYNKVQAAIESTCQGVRLGKFNSTQAAAEIQSLAVAQYKQYKIDVANLQ